MLRAGTTLIGPAPPGDPILGLLVAVLGAVFLFFALSIAAMSAAEGWVWALGPAAIGLALFAAAAWVAVKGITGRAALEIGPEGVAVHWLRPARGVQRMAFEDLVALHYGGLGDKHPVIRLEYHLPAVPDAPGHVPLPRGRARVALPRHGFEVSDLTLLTQVRQAAEAAGLRFVEKTGVPVFGRRSWVVDHRDDTVT